MAKTKSRPAAIPGDLVKMIDARATLDEKEIIRRRKETSIINMFGNEQKGAVAHFVSDLIAKGFNDQEIKETIKNKYNLEWSMKDVRVCKELLVVLWRHDAAINTGDMIASELAAIQTQQKELWKAWEMSKKNKKTTTKTGNSTSPADEQTYNLTETVVEEDDKAGDAKYMSLINDLGKERRKLLGLYAPDKKQQNAPSAIQFNIVGQGAGNEAASIMSSILNRGQEIEEAKEIPNTSAEDAKAEIIEAEANPIEAPNTDIDVELLMEEYLNE